MNGCRIALKAGRQVSVEAFDVPGQVGYDEVLVRVHYSLISPGTELSGYRSITGNKAVNPGYTAVGEVLQVGETRDPDLVGRTVFLFPAMGDFSLCHASHKLMHAGGLAVPVPEGLDPRAACFARMVNIGSTPYVNAEPKCSGTAFVIGLGLVGNVTAQVGRVRGFCTIGADPNPTRRRRAEEAAVDHVLDPAERDPLEYVLSLTAGRGADLSVNVAGLASTFLMSLQATAEGGEVSTLGGARDEVTGDVRAIMQQIHQKHLTVRGGWEMRLPMRAAPASRGSSIEINVRNALRWLRQGAVDLAPVWTHTIRPEGFAEAYDALCEMDDDYLGVVVDWQD